MPQTVILGHDDVIQLLPMSECIDVMREALSALARGEVDQPLRSLVRASGAAGFLGLMPAFRGGDRPWWGLKEVCVYPGNPARGLDSHLGAVLLHDGETGELLAIAEASAITAVRTAAVTAVATDLLARQDASVVSVIGTGAQARAHIESISLVRSVTEIRVAGSTPEKAERFCEEIRQSTKHPVKAVSSVEEAVRQADVIVTVTSSKHPVLDHSWIAAGSHLNLVGSSIRTAREADGATIAAGRLYVDRRESTINESGDYLFALDEGLIDDEHIQAEIGEVLLEPAFGRRAEDEVTIFKSLGLAIEDLAAAAYLYEKARESGHGTWVEF
ncbi:MAG: ornithine cyclodeaminase family protein [Acidobacteria bacterium]|nr:ornithine cyclodeaminase family protein [Acidobacteriota bacterium]